MKLVIDKGGKYEVQNSEMPLIKDDEVLVKVKASGVCGSDVPRVFNDGAYFYPIVLGHEFSGVIEKANDKKLIGKRVAVFPLIACGECEFCKKEQYANCVKYDYYGSRRDGGNQDYIAVKTKNLVFIPDGVSFEEGAMVEPMAVCLHAVKKLGIKSGDSVVVYGAGTIGMLCGMWAKYFGATDVYFVDIDEQKIEFANKLGYKRYSDEKVDFAIECSGAGACINGAINAVKAFSKVALVGNAHGDIVISKQTYSQLLRKQITLIGNWNSDFSSTVNDWVDSLNVVKNGGIQPAKLITHKIKLSQSEKVFDVIKARQFYNKIMIVEG